MPNALDPNNISENPQNPSKRQPEINENDQKHENLFSPRFRSVAAMAGWDEEALLIASLIVEDTPDRQFKHKKRFNLQSFKTPPTNSRRKRKAQRRSPASIPIAVLDLDEDESKSKQVFVNNVYVPRPIDVGRGALSAGSLSVNTVLWNTIQLLFPQEVETRKASASSSDGHEPPPQRVTPARITRASLNTRNRAVEALNSPPESENTGPERRNHRIRNRSSRPSGMSSRGGGVSTRTVLASQDEDAALALRLQREEFMEAFRVPGEVSSSYAAARANLRAMASRAINIRIRGRRD
ncbi:hypothetical protein DH2020_009502 [Rehmannia glutinosa]|uniref:RING-type E3 ubiquitin transferase n=1 Tax=Rehmannia glutinosa TaxID=99300 RepID=A0ABR0X9E1_REHGL